MTKKRAAAQTRMGDCPPRWERLWKIKKSLESSFEFFPEEKDEEGGTEEISTLFKTSVAPFDSDVRIGDIRLLPQKFLPEDTGPRYFAVIGEWGEDSFVVVPFSDIPIPAVQGEYDTGRENTQTRVLQAWNAVIAPKKIIEETWKADSLSDTVPEEAFRVFWSMLTGEEPPEHIQKKIGPPILSEEDPRMRYQDEETETFSKFRLSCLENS